MRHFIIFAIFCLIPPNVQAQSDFQEKEYLFIIDKFNTLQLDTIWEYCPNVDTAQCIWQTINCITLENTNGTPSQWNGIGWFRKAFTIPDSLKNKPLYFQIAHWGASEIYLDGVKVGTYGKVSDKSSLETTYLPKDPIAFIADNRPIHYWTVYYSNHRHFLPGVPAKLKGFSLGISSQISSSSQKYFTNARFMVSISFTLAFSIFFFFVYIFYPRRVASLMAAIWLLHFSVIFIGTFLDSFITDGELSRMTTLVWESCTSTINGSVLLFYYALYYGKLPKRSWVVVLIMVVLIILIWTIPVIGNFIGLFNMLFYIEIFRILYLGYRKDRNNYWILAIGQPLSVFLFLIAIVNAFGVFSDVEISTAQTFFSILSDLCLPIMLSLQLAWEYGSSNRLLQKQVTQLKILSEDNLSKEKEKQQILAIQNETLEKQVIERTEALNQSLTVLKETQTQLIEKEQIASLSAIRLQELDNVKTRLYTNITHEFRTPLTVILGMTQQIKEKPTAHLKEGLNMITRNGQNLLNLVNQMLDLSKLESGHLSLHYQQGDVVNFLKYIVESLHSLAESKDLQIHFISDLEQLTMAYDETRLQQVVSNLLSNAVKFTPKGGNIYVSLSIQNETFSFKVKDTGRGIAEADLPYIFDRFYQVDDTATRHGEGTGIGLSLTRELVKLMNGTISVKSQIHKGTEFEVVLPIHHVAVIKTESAQSPMINGATNLLIDEEEHPLPEDIGISYLNSKNDETTTDKPLILIADDNADVRAYIASCLSIDYNLLIAKDGQECEDLAFDKTPDLIISDVMMPFKDGFEVCQTLKTDERTSHIPIIMLTAKADMDSKLQGLEHGADVYLMKPFNKDELLLRIKKLLELRQQLQQFYRSTVMSANTPSGVGGTEGGKIQPPAKPNPLLNNADNTFVLKVRTFIETNLNNANFDVEKLCRDLLLSPSQVHRKLTALTGLSTNSFIRYVRLVKAKELLIQNAHFSISAVAYDCGFNDPAYFSRAFKQEFGVTPQVWREQNTA